MSAEFPAREAWRVERRAPSVRRPAVPILHVPDDRKISLIVCSVDLTGVYEHYIDNRTRPCTGQGADCWLPHEKTQSRWHGWLTVCYPGQQTQFLIALTHHAVKMSPALEEADFDLRGLSLIVWRQGKSEAAKMAAALRTDYRTDAEIPSPVEVLPHLERMWRAPNRRKPLFGRLLEQARKERRL